MEVEHDCVKGNDVIVVTVVIEAKDNDEGMDLADDWAAIKLS